MAIVKVSVPAFDGDPLTAATLAFYVLWLVVTVVQWGQAARLVSNPANALRRGIFGSVLGSVVCLAVSYGFRIGRIVIDNSNSVLAGNDPVWVAFFGIDAFTRIGGLFLIYLSVFLAVYHRVAIYVGPSSRLWFIKKIVDGSFLGLWVLMYIVVIAWALAGYVGYFVDGTMTALQYTRRLDTTRSLDSANSSFFIITHVAAIVAIVMMNSARKNVQDPIVRTMMRAMLPILVFRAIWNIIITAIYNSNKVIKTLYQSESMDLAFAIIDGLSLAILIGIMINLGSQPASWDIPAGMTAPPGSDPQQPYGAQGMVGGPPGMTMVLGPNGLPILGPNGQPMFTPVGPAPGQGQDLETWKHQSMYSATPVSNTHSNNMMPAYQQQNILPYGQFAPQQPQFIAPQQNEFSHLPQPPAGYFYQPPGLNAQAPRPDSQAFQPYPQQPLRALPAEAQGGLGRPRASLDASTQPTANAQPQPNAPSAPSFNGPPAIPPA